METRGRGPVWDTDPGICLEDLRKTRKPLTRDSRVWAEIWGRDFPIYKQKCYSLDRHIQFAGCGSVMRLSGIREVHDSNLGQETEYPLTFSSVCTVPPGEYFVRVIGDPQSKRFWCAYYMRFVWMPSVSTFTNSIELIWEQCEWTLQDFNPKIFQQVPKDTSL